MGIFIQLKNYLGTKKLFPKTSIYNSKYADSDCVVAFITKMNEKAASIGMEDSTFINPSGLGMNGNYSSSTAFDLARLGVAALAYKDLCEIWNVDSHSVKVKGKSSILVTTSVTSPSLENYYPIIGGKTGAGDGYYALVIATMIDGNCVVGAIASASSNDGRFQAMKQLFDAAKIVLNGGTPSASAVTSALYACAVKVPPYNPASMGVNDLEVLYNQSAKTAYPPMSTTKILTALTFLDYVKDLSVCTTITAKDVENTTGTSGAIFSVGDVVTLSDLMFAAMLPSSNQAANALARVAGNVILQNDAFEIE